MKIYNIGKNKKYENWFPLIRETYNEEVEKTNDKSPFHFLNSIHMINENGKVILVFSEFNNNWYNKAIDALLLKRYGIDFETLIFESNQKTLSKTKENEFRILSELGVKIINKQDYISEKNEIRRDKESLPKYIKIEDNKITIQYWLDGYGPLATQDANSIPLYFAYAKMNGLIVNFDDDFFNLKSSNQKGMTDRAKEFITYLIYDDQVFTKPFNHDFIKYDTSKPNSSFKIPNRIMKQKYDVPEFEEIDFISSYDGTRKTNNLHKKMQLELANYLFEENEKNKILVEENNEVNADIVMIDEDDVAHIYEIKSFINNTYYKAVGQLLTYKNDVILKYGIHQVELYLYIIESQVFSKAFQKTLDESNIIVKWRK